MIDDAKCKCCGARIGAESGSARIVMRVCAICSMCDRRHGDQLQLAVHDQLASGRITWGLALARMLVDDAHMAGLLAFVDDGSGRLNLWVVAGVPRWRVIVGRAVAAGEPVDIPLAISVICARHLPGRATTMILSDIRQEIFDMLRLLDGNVHDVIVRSPTGGLRPQDLEIEVVSTSPDLLATNYAPDVEVPDDIMTRPRGQA